ncbi:hypothetical protein NDU88_003308 [Pleurodeles waltl]|uniref:Uncharacterized protein n=1 Tax=Pleurodeles waltl TaxID=8319 RepID=A0AAV7TQ76_PLEWA|nr:hypothetical protein NDU88_003308 [Pleurodeles waltl]
MGDWFFCVAMGRLGSHLSRFSLNSPLRLRPVLRSGCCNGRLVSHNYCEQHRGLRHQVLITNQEFLAVVYLLCGVGIRLVVSDWLCKLSSAGSWL